MRYATFGTLLALAWSAAINAAPIPGSHASITPAESARTVPSSEPEGSQNVRLERRVINKGDLSANDHHNEQVSHEKLRDEAKKMAEGYRSAAAVNRINQENALSRQEAHSGTLGDGEAFERAEKPHKAANKANLQAAEYMDSYSKYHDHAAKYHEYSAKGIVKGWHAELEDKEKQDAHLSGQVNYAKAAASHKAVALKMSKNFPPLQFQHEETPPSSPPQQAHGNV
ncbi:hypothetical protein FRC14_000405 [Serendipita sp. 396]|nr:hypothetical protein FRC14_000405 [Serendipita sp. 396]KAG8775614.1 hypothetical protein FRC15_000431 [Serendipita sp. 397]KAG8791570.1 hypothetical protein FRC16_000355 [Serendipita sp. 398]KAG8822588.1 hypothetical protein FRC19_005642 [Serendipita sp. 401]KAG8856711.1 hypothetical protein FRC20_000415 [Serendipita sp. 405]KAG9051415.1 hypothetical protein FS842_011220 [Serendipita sp. 407]